MASVMGASVLRESRRPRMRVPQDGQSLREHLRQQRGPHRIPDEDKPAHMLPSTNRLLVRAQAAGPLVHLSTRSGGRCIARTA
jgi:hypothetical protein